MKTAVSIGLFLIVLVAGGGWWSTRSDLAREVSSHRNEVVSAQSEADRYRTEAAALKKQFADAEDKVQQCGSAVQECRQHAKSVLGSKYRRGRSVLLSCLADKDIDISRISVVPTSEGSVSMLEVSGNANLIIAFNHSNLAEGATIIASAIGPDDPAGADQAFATVNLCLTGDAEVPRANGGKVEEFGEMYYVRRKSGKARTMVVSFTELDAWSLASLHR